MKFIFSLLVSVVCLVCDAQTMATRVFYTAGGGVPSGGPSCPSDGSFSIGQTNANTYGFLGTASDDVYSGQIGWSNSTAITICKLGFHLTKWTGDISTKTYRAYVMVMTNATAADVSQILATSDAVTGSNAWTNTMVRFTFPTPLTLAPSSTNYALVVGLASGGSSGANYIRPGYTNASTGITGSYSYLSTTGVGSLITSETAFEIYTQ